MTRQRYAFAILIALALVATIPNVSMAENTQAGQAPQPKGGIAIVVGVDQPENCLRIRSGPGTYYDVIGCANMGEQLNITGVWTTNDWAQLSDNGWVYGPQIQTDLRPPRHALSENPTYVVQEEVTPDYADWAYLPDFGYETYWYGGLPIYVYHLNVWHWFHPWWWHRGHQAWWWQRGHHGKRPWNANEFRNYVRARGHGGGVKHRATVSSFNRAGTRRNLRINRSGISPSNVTRFNTRQFRSGSTNDFRGRTFSYPNRFRSGSVNSFRSRTFSMPQTFRSGSFGGRQFRGIARSGSFNIGGGRSFHFGGGRGFHFGGGRFGGGRRR